MISETLASEFNISSKQSEDLINLIKDGNTIPFINSYRKELTNSLSYDSLQKFSEKLDYLKKLEKRKEEVTESIKNKEKLTDEIKKIIDESETLIEVDDIYNQYVEEKETKTESSKKKTLSKLANIIRFQQTEIPIEEIAKDFISKDEGIETIEDAISGSQDIIAGIVADNADFRYLIRKITLEEGKIITEPIQKEESSVYEIYYDHSEDIYNIASHKVLAINRGESEGFLKVKIEAPKDEIISYLNRHTLIDRSDNYSQDYNVVTKTYIEEAILNSYDRLIAPSIEKEIREYLTNRAEDKSIEIFSDNLEHLLMQSPTKNKVILGWYPSLYASSKLAVLDKEGKILKTSIANPLGSENNIDETKKTILDLINEYSIDLIALGDIQDSKKLEQIIANIIQGTEVKYALINQAGASAYSSSALAEIEFPDINKGHRTAISIAKRLQDPLVEFVKVDPKTIGVGQYQHDMNQEKLNESLANIIEKVVNNVGVDLNTASISLLNYVSGIDSAIATDIVRYREDNGLFKSRDELLKLDSIDSEIFKQSAGFLKVYSSDNPLDQTSIHPESYEVAKKLIEKLGYNLDDLFLEDLAIEEINFKDLSDELNVGEETLNSIAIQLKNPEIDPRDNMHKPILRSDTLLIEDLKEGMTMEGMVRNVVDFGAFIDIGVHHDGLIHISKMDKGNFVKHPSDIVSVGDIVKVKILEIDLNKNRIQLSLC
ncbi:MAG: helix-hairpin-helix domain-containing protein [Methanobrevibacter sp.]|nr:helix-hairpin-helix domain-containing protein [Methanobrevibacter sp.]